MKLYTDEQVKMLLEKMSLVTERKNLGVSANFRHRTIEIDKLLKDISPIELPTDEEIDKNGYHDEEYNQVWTDGAKWLRDKIGGNNGNNNSN
jgi:hypothetical protein